MTSDEPDAIISYNLDDEPDEDLPTRSYWWSLHRPETWAIAAFAVALASLLSLAPAQEIAQAIIFGSQPDNSEKVLLLTLAGIRLGICVLTILAAMLSIRSEDEDSTWSPPVARAAILLATLAALLSAGSLIAALLMSNPSLNNGF